MGGAGYVEESGMPRLYRQAPLNSIWEGSGNIQCLDVLRALAREPDTRAALLAELRAAAGRDAGYDAALAAGSALLAGGIGEAQARQLVEALALLLQAATLLRAGHPLARDWCATRLAGAGGLSYGASAVDIDIDTAIGRILPA